MRRTRNRGRPAGGDGWGTGRRHHPQRRLQRPPNGARPHRGREPVGRLPLQPSSLRRGRESLLRQHRARAHHPLLQAQRGFEQGISRGCSPGSSRTCPADAPELTRYRGVSAPRRAAALRRISAYRGITRSGANSATRSRLAAPHGCAARRCPAEPRCPRPGLAGRGRDEEPMLPGDGLVGGVPDPSRDDGRPMTHGLHD